VKFKLLREKIKISNISYAGLIGQRFRLHQNLLNLLAAAVKCGSFLQTKSQSQQINP